LPCLKDVRISNDLRAVAQTELIILHTNDSTGEFKRALGQVQRPW